MMWSKVSPFPVAVPSNALSSPDETACWQRRKYRVDVCFTTKNMKDRNEGGAVKISLPATSEDKSWRIPGDSQGIVILREAN